MTKHAASELMSMNTSTSCSLKAARLGLLKGVCISRQVFLASGVREEDPPLLQLIYMLKEIYALHGFTQHIM